MFVSEDDFKRADWPLLQNGAVNLFFAKSYLEETQAQLRALDYEVIEIIYEAADSFRSALTVALRWQQQFGYSPWTGNLDALDDAFSSFPFRPSKSAAICVSNYDWLMRENEHLGQTFLDIIENQSKSHLLHGCRLLALIQTNDPKISFEKLGARAAQWNRRERMMKDRGLA